MIPCTVILRYLNKTSIHQLMRDLRWSVKYVRAVRPYMFAHHPICEPYSKDVLHFGGTRFCWGCLVTYPTAITVLMVMVLTGWNELLPWFLWFPIGVLFGAAELLNLLKKRAGSVHRLINFCLGTGMALMTLAVFMMPIFICFRLYIFFMLYMLAGLLITYRVRNFEKRCAKCSWKKDWNDCPGFRDLHDKLKKEGLE